MKWEDVTKQMGRRPASFRQRDVTRAIKAAKAAGGAYRVEIDRNGTIAIIGGGGIDKPAGEIVGSHDGATTNVFDLEAERLRSQGRQ